VAGFKSSKGSVPQVAPFEGCPSLDGYHCQTNSLAKIFYHARHPLSEDVLLGLGAGMGYIYWQMKMGKEKFVPIVTGHQGEPGSILTRIALGDTPYQLTKGDKVIFSANIIPNPMNFGQRYKIEQHLKMAGSRIFEDLHSSQPWCLKSGEY
jgi:mRNA degradation ribonuclease J1/J2